MDKPEETEQPDYSHTQKSPLCFLLYGLALACITVALTADYPKDVLIFAGVGLLCALLAPALHHLTVLDKGDRLSIRFGPLPLLRRTVRYADIVKVEVGRTLLFDGWGIHYSIRGGWVWNIWGRDCVVLHLNKSTLRIGTDVAENLCRFLEKRSTEVRP